MILYIDTTESGQIKIALKRERKILVEKKVKAIRQEAEKLLSAIGSLLKAKKINLKQIKKIEVENRGGSFTSLRIGVITANALAYALGLPAEGSDKPETKIKKGMFSIVKPAYDREPEITKKKARNS